MTSHLLLEKRLLYARIAAGGVVASAERANFLSVHSTRGALWKAGIIYIRNFPTTLFAFWLPLLPLDVLAVLIPSEQVAYLVPVWVILGLIGFSAASLAVSDVCNGNRPSIRGTYSRIRQRKRQVLLSDAALAATVIVPSLVGVISLWLWPAFFLAGLFLLALFIFAPVAAVTEENITIAAALERSTNLQQKYVGRTILVGMAASFLVFFMTCLFAGIAMGIGAAIHEPLATSGPLATKVLTVLLIVFSRLTVPWAIAAIVLLYYDLRARKEGYNLRMLVEDLWRP
jgi:hypothetical protein